MLARRVFHSHSRTATIAIRCGLIRCARCASLCASSACLAGASTQRRCVSSKANKITTFMQPVDEDLKFRSVSKVASVNPIEMTDACEILFDHTINNEETLAFVLGAPGCGKTSLANGYINFLKAKGYDPIVIPLGVPLKHPRAYIAKANTTVDKAVFVVDEAHTMFVQGVNGTANSFVDVFLKNRPYYVACFSTTVSDKFGTTPQVLKNHKFWYYGPTSDRGKLKNFTQKVVSHVGGDPKSFEGVTTSLFDYCGAHMEVTMCTLAASIEKGRKGGRAALASIDDVVKGQNPPRAVVNGNNWGDAHNALAERLLASGSMPLSEIVVPEQKELLRKGFVAPVRPNGCTKTLAKFNDSDELTWAHGWQIDAARINKVKPLPTEPVPGVKIENPLQLLINVLPHFKLMSFFSTKLSVANHASSASEYHFQDALGVALTVAGFTYTNEYPIERYRLDFFVTSDNGDKWGIELLLDSSKIDEHVKRFSKRGKYATAKLDKWVVVDCRTKPLSMGARNKPNKTVVTIAPHEHRGWDTIVVHDGPGGKRYNIPRDGVPRYLKGGKVMPARRVDWTSVSPPTTWVTGKRNTAAFKVTPASNDIDSLKKAIKAEWDANKPTKMDALTLTIFEWDAAANAAKKDAVMKQSTPLHANTEETPYTFKV